MFEPNIVLSSSGSLAVAFVALFFFVFQGWIYLNIPSFSWNKWGALLSFATAVYSTAVFVQFNTPPGAVNHYAEIFQYSTFVVVIHSLYGFTFTYLQIKTHRYHLVAGIAHTIILLVIWSTHLIIAQDYVYRSFLWLNKPYIEPQLGPLGHLFLLYIVLAATYCLTYWVRYRNRKIAGTNAFIFGFLLWTALGVHDAAATMGFKSIQFVMEYGFLGFSTAIMYVTLKKYMELAEIAETHREAVEKANEKLELRVKVRTDELEKSNRELLAEISQRKWAHAALMESEQRFRTIFHTSPDAVNIHRLNGEFVEINDGFTTLSGYSREDVNGKIFEDLISWDSVGNRHSIFEKLDKFGSVDNVEIWFRCKSGQKKAGLFSARIINLNGENHILTITRDIGKWKKVEEDKKKLESKLQRAQKMEAIGTLAGGVAHDLNNILSGIVGYPDLMLMDLPQSSPLRQPLSAIQKSGIKAAAIVQDLLTLARRGVSNSEVLDLNSIIRDYLKSPEFEKVKNFHAGLRVETNLDSELLNISGSPVHLSKTLMNLVSNAAEAMPHGGRIFISTQNKYLDQPIEGYDEIEEGDYVLLKISDSGIGIRAEDKERIFEPFYTKKIMGRSGTGLGMAVVWGTVKDHKGYIDIHSTEGKGTTFTLYFPITREPLSDNQYDSPTAAFEGKGEKILVVDDVEEQRQIASLILKRLGYNVDSVCSGEKAVEYLKTNSVDLLVLDMIMEPGIDGLETYKNILDFKPNQKAIIASGFSETDRVKEALRLGAGAYVKKPYTIEKIAEAACAELYSK